MIDWNVVKSAIYNWALNYSGLNPSTDQQKVIFSNQIGVQPVRPYITLNISNVTKVTHDDLRYKGPDLEFEVSGLRSFTLGVQAFSAEDLFESMTLISSLQNSLNFPAVNEFLKTNSLSYVSVSNITNVTELMDTSFDSRHSIDVVFYIGSNIDQTVDIIEHTEIDGEIEYEEVKKGDIEIVL